MGRDRTFGPATLVRRARGSARRSGLLLAVGLAVVFVGVIAWSASRRRQAPLPIVTVPQDRPPDIKSAPGGADQPGSFRGGTNFELTLADRDDPSRRAGLITAAQADPGESRTYIFKQPEVWWFTRDGKALRFRADRGQAYLPSEAKGARPESGTFHDNVVFEMYDCATGRIDDALKSPVLLAGSTSRISYDGTLNEIDLPEPFQIHGDWGSCAGAGAALIVNELKQRLDRLRVERVDQITLNPKGIQSSPARPAPPAPAPAPTPPVASGAPQPASPAPAPEKKEPQVVAYALAASRSVSITQGPRTITSDTLSAWARLIDNHLPPGALALADRAPRAPRTTDPSEVGGPRFDLEPAGVEPPPHTATPTPGSPGPSSAESASDLRVVDSDAPVVFRFAGPLEIRSLPSAPPELSDDHLAVRFTAVDEGSAVRFRDTQAKATASGRNLDYAGTRSLVTLAGAPAQLGLDASGSAEGSLFRMDLRSGVGRVEGPSRLLAAAEPGKEPTRSMSWTDGADFAFVTRDGKATSTLKEIHPRGSVQARDDAGSMSADAMDVRMGAGVDARAYIARVEMRGKASAQDGRGGSLSGDSITADLAPTGKSSSEPTHVEVLGNARGVQGDDHLSARQITADLARDDAGKRAITAASASGDVRYDGRDGVWAAAHTLAARPREQVVDLQGEGAAVGQGDSRVSGNQLRLSGGNERGITVFGPGAFDHADPKQGGKVRATWTSQMTFQDAQGLLECAGSVRTDWQPDPHSRDRIDAERVQLWLERTEPGPPATRQPAASAPGDPLALGGVSGGRRLVRAQAWGSIAEREGGTRAQIESRRFAAGDVLERLLYLEGEQILADNQKGSLSVPGPGRLFSLDHRAAAARDSLGQGLSADAQTGQGEAKFEWTGSMTADREAKKVTLHQGVRMRHHRRDDGLLTDLECEDLLAVLDQATQPKPGDQAPAFSGELQSTWATGRAWLRSGQREISAEELLYDAAQGVVSAKGKPGGDVTAFDHASATPVTAKAIRWDLKSGRLDAIEPGTLVAPH